jgi:hypothetical protein
MKAKFPISIFQFQCSVNILQHPGKIFQKLIGSRSRLET